MNWFQFIFELVPEKYVSDKWQTRDIAGVRIFARMGSGFSRGLLTDKTDITDAAKDGS